MDIENKSNISDVFGSKTVATLAGFSALATWALSPMIISELGDIPTFQLSAILFFTAFLYSGFSLTFNQRWSLLAELPIRFYAISLTILINQVAYIYAIKFAPPEQVEIIYYLWPILVIMSSMMLFNHKKNVFPLISAALGLAGVYILLTDDNSGFHKIEFEYYIGYFFAFSSAIAWVVYSLFARYNTSLPKESNGIWCGICSLACFALHLFLEQTVLPSLYESALMFFIGSVTLAFSLNMWSMGMRYGHFNTLNIASYMVPLFSILMLMAVGKAEFKQSLLLSCQLIILGSCICTLAKWTRKKLRAHREIQ